MSVFHFVTFDFLISADADVIAKETDFFELCVINVFSSLKVNFNSMLRNSAISAFQFLTFRFCAAHTCQPIVRITDKSKLLVVGRFAGQVSHSFLLRPMLANQVLSCRFI